MIKARVKGKVAAKRSSVKTYRVIRDASKDGLKDASEKVVKNARRIMSSGNRSGKLYDSGRNDGSKHRASRAGEPLASDTGRLERSIRAQSGASNSLKRGKGVVTYHVGSPLKSMRWEVGDGSGTGDPKPNAARPTLRAALIPKLRVEDVKRKIKRALK